MIIVDVEIEALDKVYDFKLDDEVPISKIIDDICEMLSQKEKCAASVNSENLILFARKTGSILSQNMTLRNCNVVSGDKLMLI